MIQLQTREARTDENYTTVVNGPRCRYLAYALGDASHQELVCGGGESPAAAVKVAQSTIHTYGLEALRSQQQAKVGHPAIPGTEAAVFYTFGLKPVAEHL